MDGESAHGVLLELNREAEACGLRPGMNASQALARCKALELLAASATSEMLLEEVLLRFVETLSPRVERQDAARWVLDLRGLRVGDWREWGAKALEGLREREGVEAVFGIAPGRGLAWCAAQRASPVLVVEEEAGFAQELRFEEVGVSAQLQQHLYDWGLLTLGDLLRLPRQAVLERLGSEAASLWELARDNRESVLRLERFPQPLEVELDFEHPAESVEAVLFVLNRLIEQLCSRLRLLQRVAVEVRLKLSLESGQSYERAFTLPAPSREEGVLLRILETHLETLQFESAVTAAGLRVKEVPPTAQQLGLFENPLRDPNRFGETLARLKAMVGEGGIGVPVLSNTHRRGAFTLADPQLILGGTPRGALPPGDGREGGVLLGLPLRRFRPPIEVRVGLREHQPAEVFWGGEHFVVQACSGPFRFGGEWWDVFGWQREEWDVLLGGRERGMYRLGCHAWKQGEGSRRWFLEGCYHVRAAPLGRAGVPVREGTRGEAG